MGDWEYNVIGHEEVTPENVARFFNYCDGCYNATEDGCEQSIDQWQKKADRFDELFRNIPGYVEGKHCIVLKYAWLRELNKKGIRKFSEYINNLSYEIRKLTVINGKTKKEWCDEYYRLNGILSSALHLPPSLLNYHALKGYKEANKIAWNMYYNMNEYTSESEELYENICKLKEFICNYTDQFVNEEALKLFSTICPEAKIALGQKMSRAVKKMCAIFGLTSDSDWEKMYAAYADAINPMYVDKNVCISWNYYDFLTMSQGNSWKSCHDIYDVGCYSSGCLSYAEDDVSLIVYMLPDDYKDYNQPLWNIPKVKRQMFHIFDDGRAFIQARLYPDDQTDHGYGCDFSSYKEWREMMQDIISKAYGKPNLWKNIRGNGEITKYTWNYGTHYTDYTHYENCNLSYACDEDEIGVINIGHDPHCPSCGNEHNDSECCTCEDCRERKITCEDCGQRVREDDAYYIDGYYYCRNCVTYCEYHERYEHAAEDDMTYIDEYGRVCDDGIDGMTENGYLYECDECGGYSLNRNTYAYDDTENDETYHFCTCHCRDRYVERNFPRMA